MHLDFLAMTLSEIFSSFQDGEEVVDVINQLTELPHWDMIVFTKDWHPNDHISFVTNAHKFNQHVDSLVSQ